MSIENPRQRRQRIEAVQETPGTIYERMSKAMNQPSDTSEQTPDEATGYQVAHLDDRIHHSWHKADRFGVDIYKTGEIVVVARNGEKIVAVECNEEQLKEHNAELTAALAERDELAAWKREMLSVMPPLQEIGKAIGLTLGVSIHDKILPAILSLIAARDSAVAEVVQWKNRDTYRENLITELRNERDRFRAAQQQAEKERDDIRSRMDGLFGTLKSVQSQRSEAEATIAELRAQLLTAEAQAAGMRDLVKRLIPDWTEEEWEYAQSQHHETIVNELSFSDIVLVRDALANPAASPLLERLRAAEDLVKQAKDAFDDIPACMLPHEASCDSLMCTCWQSSRVRFITAAMKANP